MIFSSMELVVVVRICYGILLDILDGMFLDTVECVIDLPFVIVVALWIPGIYESTPHAGGSTNRIVNHMY